MSDPDSIRYKVETFFFGVTSRTMELGDGMASVEAAEDDAQTLANDLYSLLAENGYEISPIVTEDTPKDR